ncbi:MAG TPA: response regulator, partial [Thermoleophilia bacterium]|nr:response regulator [Thermoleophilia bacterium]
PAPAAPAPATATVARPEAAPAARPAPQPKERPAAGAVKAPAAEVAHQGDTIRVSLSRLTDLMLRMEELITVKLVFRQRTGELNDLMTEFDVWKKRWQAVRTSLAEDAERRAADVWLGEPPPQDETADARRRGGDKLIEYVNWNTEFVNELAGRIAALTLTSENDMRGLGPLVEDLLDDVKTLVMLPFSSLSQAFPKMVRDLARSEGKAVDLTVTGGDIEIDRHVLETIKDPIVHILRNCVGHGIETPDVRAKRGKPVRGQVTIAVTRVEGNKLSILITDDGGGIDVRGVRQIAGKVGARSQDQLDSLDDAGALSLVFESGVSTNPIVTDVSGRGIGLAIVQEKVEQLGGSAHVSSSPGAGSSFELIVPATVASSRGVIVRVSDRLFVLPTLHVDRVTRVDPATIATIENTDTVPLDGETVAFAFLHDVLSLQRKVRGDETDLLPVVVLMSGNDRIAFAVDWILGEQEVLVKGLGPQLESVRYVTGATVLESERVALILHPPEVLRAATHGTVQSTPVATVLEESVRRKKKILVAEDSITSRTLLKNILETTGYEVRTVVDGVEAMTALMEEEFDLLISDVEMPRMNGFDLTARIRADARHAELPVMLVTSLESREDREKGVDVGANAYITKGSFDQTTLLETARRLV